MASHKKIMDFEDGTVRTKAGAALGTVKQTRHLNANPLIKGTLGGSLEVQVMHPVQQYSC